MNWAAGAQRDDNWGAGFVLWTRTVGETCYTIRIDQSSYARMEGETEIAYFRDDFRLFTLTFAAVAGRLLAIPHAHTMFIGGMQGTFAGRDHIRAAARDMGEIAPAAMVLLAARVLSRALDLGGIVAVNSVGHVSQNYAGDRLRFSYDDYWQAVGASRLPNGLFLLQIHEGEGSMDHLSPQHRARARRKRRLKAEIAAEMADLLSARLQPRKGYWPAQMRPTLAIVGAS